MRRSGRVSVTVGELAAFTCFKRTEKEEESSALLFLSLSLSPPCQAFKSESPPRQRLSCQRCCCCRCWSSSGVPPVPLQDGKDKIRGSVLAERAWPRPLFIFHNRIVNCDGEVKPTVACGRRGFAGLQASRLDGRRGLLGGRGLALGAAVLTRALRGSDITTASGRNTCLVIREALSWTKSGFIQSPQLHIYAM